MTNTKLNFEKGLSIQELEERHELSVAITGDVLEATKDDDNDTTVIRCGGNCNDC